MCGTAHEGAGLEMVHHCPHLELDYHGLLLVQDLDHHRQVEAGLVAHLPQVWASWLVHLSLFHLAKAASLI